MEFKYSIDAVNLDGLNDGQLELIKKLNTSLYMGIKTPNKSIMEYGEICDCDSGFLCEHRLQFIINFIKENHIS